MIGFIRRFNMISLRSASILLILLLAVLVGCTGEATNPILTSPGNLSHRSERYGSGHNIWSSWTIIFEEDTLSVSIISERQAGAHFDVTSLVLPPSCEGCFEITVNSYDPATKILDIDVTLKNPTGLDGRDVRGIFFTDDPGRTIVNADDWTSLWDIPDGQDINPFRAFAKSIPCRVFAPSETYTENYLIKMTHWGAVHYAVDASWPDNCEEPYEISGFTQEIIREDEGSSGAVSVTVSDWLEDTDEVIISAPEITGTEFIELAQVADSTWSVEITNSTGASSGIYPASIKASSEGDGALALYDKVEIEISETHPVLNVLELTPPWLNFTPVGVFVDGNYLYTAGSQNGLHLWDISDPGDPIWVTRVEVEPQVYDVYIENGLAYAIKGGRFDIFDVDPPGEINYLGSLEGFSQYMDIQNGYLFEGGLKIWDIDPWQTAHLVRTVDLELESCVMPTYVTAADGMAYVVVYDQIIGDGGMRIVHADPPETAWLAATVDYYRSVGKIDAENGVGCLTLGDTAIIFDSATGSTITNIGMPASKFGVEIIDGYAYISGTIPAIDPLRDSVQVIDLHVPEEAEIINTIWCGAMLSIARSGNYVYVSSNDEGLYVFEYVPPAEPVLQTIIPSPATRWLAAGDGIAATGNDITVAIADATMPSGPEFISSLKPVQTEHWLWSAAIEGNYLYIAGNYLHIIDISDPGNPILVNSVNTMGDITAIDVSDGYACIVGQSYGFEIIDVDPPEIAYSVGSLELEYRGEDVVVQEDVAYMIDYHYYDSGEFHVIDISDPGSPEIMRTVGNAPGDPIYSTYCLDLFDDYAYVGMGGGATADFLLRIIDISNPADAYILNEIELSQNPDVFCISSGYMFLEWYDPVLENGIKILDLSSPTDPQEVGFFKADRFLSTIAVGGPYLYTASQHGLSIFQLW